VDVTGHERDGGMNQCRRTEPTERRNVKANVGDWLVIEPTNLGDRRRSGLIVALRHEDGTPPYVVRWVEDDHESLMFPGPTARVEHRPHAVSLVTER
jgi:hypothetical protein